MKRYALALAGLYILGALAVVVSFSQIGQVEPDVVAINGIVMGYWEEGLSGAEPDVGSRELVDELTAFFSSLNAKQAARDTQLRNTLLIVMTGLAAAGLALIWAIDRRVLAPFRKLEDFAASVAAGNLDVPLQMDKGGSFGAFTESFDLMRDELARARASEQRIEQGRKELVASLSHDIKTPVASIKAVSELMAATSTDSKALEQLKTISIKADQIDTLVSNLFSATLEELQELPVVLREAPSTSLYQLIANADYRKLATVSDIPECLVIADLTRLAQVFDNIFENSYKYAGTAIDVSSSLEDQHLCLSITDHGPGALPEELALLTQKFFRGSNAQDQGGSGLGLYLSKHFIERMSGELFCLNGPDGFTVRLALAYA